MDEHRITQGTSEQVRQRLALLIGGRVVDRQRRLAAAGRMDAIRRALPGFDTTEEVRRWRDR